MSDADDHAGMSEDEWLAAESALGVLSGEERAAASLRARRQSAFAALIAKWEERLSPWLGELDEVTPPAHVWDSILAALPASATRSAGLWQSLAFWRGLAFAGGAVAAASIAALVYLGTATPAVPLVAALDGGGHRHFVATVDPARGSVVVIPAAYSADVTRVPELWLIPPGDKPHALGLLRADRTATITIPHDLLADATPNAVLAVSLEPPGGSPTGQPTGPVIASGKLANL